MVTQGDRAVGPLTDQGGKGLFIKEIEVALAENQADIAVHSIKDLPCPLDPAFQLTAVLQRDDPRDAWLHREGLHPDAAPKGTRVGTGSPRRVASLRRHYPHLEPVPMRGNVGTRLGKMESGEVDALILSCSGLDRMEMGHRITWRIDPEKMIPAIGQGTIGIETRANDAATQKLLAPINHAPSLESIVAEREVLLRLGGDCHSAIGGWIANGRGLAFCADPQTSKWVAAEVPKGPTTFSTAEIANRLYSQLEAAGAADILRR